MLETLFGTTAIELRHLEVGRAVLGEPPNYAVQMVCSAQRGASPYLFVLNSMAVLFGTGPVLENGCELYGFRVQPPGVS